MRASGVSSKAAKEQLELVNTLERKAHEAAKNVERMDTKLKQELTCVECGGAARCICTTECFPHSGILTVFPSFLLPRLSSNLLLFSSPNYRYLSQKLDDMDKAHGVLEQDNDESAAEAFSHSRSSSRRLRRRRLA